MTAVEGVRVEAGPAALADLYVAYHRRLLGLAGLVCDDPATAEDLVQEAFARLPRRHVATPEVALAYLRTTILNLSRSRLRRLRTARRFARPDEETAASAEESAVVREDHAEVLAAVRLLPARQRQALVLRFWDDLTVAETARAMGLSEGAVKSHTHRGVAAVRRSLEATR